MRSFLQRLDLLDHEDRRLATVEHQVEDADDLIHWIQQTVQEHRSDHATMQRRFGRRSGDRFRFLMLGLGICAGFAILWWLVPDLSAWWLLALPALLVGLHVVTAGAICQVDLTDDELIIFTLWRTTRIPRSGIFGIDLEMEGDDFQGRYARAMILLDDGTWREITPLGCDALEVYDSLSVWWDRSPA